MVVLEVVLDNLRICYLRMQQYARLQLLGDQVQTEGGTRLIGEPEGNELELLYLMSSKVRRYTNSLCL